MKAIKFGIASVLVIAVIAAAIIAGCSGEQSLSDSSAVSSDSTVHSSDSSTYEKPEKHDGESSGPESSSQTSSGNSAANGDDDDEDKLSSTAVVWDYPIGENLSYNFCSGNIIKELEDSYLKTGGSLGYTGEWCAQIVSDLLIEDGYKVDPTYNPCDLAIELLNNGYAEFYCLREENYDSLVYWGLSESGQSRVTMVDYDFAPQRGDFICFLWTEESDIYNWSHIGTVAVDYDGSGVIYTIEGNVGTPDLPDDPRVRSVGGREREYNETVVGFIRLTV